jgi:hypothetical protein
MLAQCSVVIVVKAEAAAAANAAAVPSKAHKGLSGAVVD